MHAIPCATRALLDKAGKELAFRQYKPVTSLTPDVSIDTFFKDSILGAQSSSRTLGVYFFRSTGSVNRVLCDGLITRSLDPVYRPCTALGHVSPAVAAQRQK